MSFSSAHNLQEKQLRQTFEKLPLPTATVVIDVRHNEPYNPSLLEYLMTDVEDLAMAMRLYRIPRWRYITELVNFLKLEELPSSVNQEADYILTTRGGEQVPISGLENMASFIGRNHLDRVRNARIGAVRDSEAVMAVPRSIDPEQSTVRVFLLADMEERESLDRAASYGQILKAWTAEAHGPRRFNRAEIMQAVTLCLNARSANYHEALVNTLGQAPAIDAVLLLENYSDDEAYIGGNAQMYQAELIMYALLLHWPETFERKIEDVRQPYVGREAFLFPWPLYIVGVSAIEHSARWITRWINYGMTARLLEMLNDTQPLEQQVSRLQVSAKTWLMGWWQQVQSTVSSLIPSTFDNLQVFESFTQALARTRESTPGQVLRNLDDLRKRVGALYLGEGPTLQYALNNKLSLIEQLDGILAQPRGSEEDASPSARSNENLVTLYQHARQFLPNNFQGAWGALPRAQHQLASLSRAIGSINAVALHPPDLIGCQDQFVRQVDAARTQMEVRLGTWKLPLIGRMMYSTVISGVIVILLCALIVTGIGLSVVYKGPVEPYSKVLLVLSCIGGQWLYLALRNQSIKHTYRQLHADLSTTVYAHLSEASAVIAAYVALALLQKAGLYTPDESTSPSEKNLGHLAQLLKDGQEQAKRQHLLADARLKLTAGDSTSLTGIQWPGLSNRKELASWDQVTDLFLRACEELKTTNPQANMLARLILRRPGTESPTDLLEEVLREQLEQNTSSTQERFLAIGVLLTAILLTSEADPPPANTVLSVLKHYTALEELFVQEPSLLIGDTLQMQATLKKILLEQVQERKMVSKIPFSQLLPPAFVLASWMGSQLYSNPQLAQLFEVDDVLQRLVDAEIAPAQVLELLRTQCTLPGHADDTAGDDAYYLFLTPGANSEALVEELVQENDVQTHLALFPDQEKLLYMHIHRVRQVLSGNYRDIYWKQEKSTLQLP